MKFNRTCNLRSAGTTRTGWAAALILTLAACSADDTAPARTAEAAPDDDSAMNAAPEHFGAPFSAPPAPTVALAQLLSSPDRAPEHPVLVEGFVRQACTRRGCWFELATSMAADAPGCRVILKDHAFFVPLDSAGAHARVEGTATVKTVSAAQVNHMEEEGGRFDHKNADGSALELRMIASGVALRR